MSRARIHIFTAFLLDLNGELLWDPLQRHTFLERWFSSVVQVWKGGVLILLQIDWIRSSGGRGPAMWFHHRFKLENHLFWHSLQEKCYKSQVLLINAITPRASQGIYYSAKISVLQRSDPHPVNIPDMAWLKDLVFHIWLRIWICSISWLSTWVFSFLILKYR